MLLEQIKFRKISKHFSIENNIHKILIYSLIHTNKLRKFYLNTIYYLDLFLPRIFFIPEISSIKAIYMLLIFILTLLTLKIRIYIQLYICISYIGLYILVLFLIEKASCNTFHKYRQWIPTKTVQSVALT